LPEERLDGLLDRLPVQQSLRWLARQSDKQFDRLLPLQSPQLSAPLFDR
jgi:hypothetical protein